MGFFDAAPKLMVDVKLMQTLHEIIETTSQQLIIISPYVDPGRNVSNAVLKVAARASVTVLFREDKLRDYQDETWFQEWTRAGVDLRVVERLHSKIYVNDTRAVVGSANFTKESWTDSRELALVFDRSSSVGEQVQAYVSELLAAARPLGTRSSGIPKKAPPVDAYRGHCIRCRTEISLNPKQPYCRDDWREWNDDGADDDEQEEHCHDCGDPASTSRRRPLCRKCYEASQ